MSHVNRRVPNAKEYYPLNEPIIGSTLPAEHFPQNKEIPALFKPLTIRGLTIPNRIVVSPMCQYSSDNGHATTWHLVHIGGFATRGAGAIIVEATAVVPEGRISPEDAGLWTDSQIPPLRTITDFVHAQGGKIGIQLAHAGRKASTLAPWVYASADRTRGAGRNVALKDEGGWPDDVVGPSDLPWSDDYPRPKALTEEQIKDVVAAFAASTKRSISAGYDFIEIHGAHGYLIHSFLSPQSNKRTDAYGGSFENRVRILLEIVDAIRGAMPESMPLFVRLSGTDWVPDAPEKDDAGGWVQWGPEQTVLLAAQLKTRGVDLIDVSSGGNVKAQKIPIGAGYQAPFARAVKEAHGKDVLVGSVGMIYTPQLANELVEKGAADVVMTAREFIRDPNFVLTAAAQLGVAIKPAVQYERGWTRVINPKI